MKFLYGGACLAILLGPQPLLAQTAPTPAATPSSPANENGLEDIVVTAQKRSESLQNVPAAVTAFSEKTIRDYRLNDIRSIADRTPNFVIGQQGPASPTLTIRGIGSSDREAGSDRSVVVFVDEVYIGRAGASTFDLFDVSQIEVLRGPQGSLFGKNAVGGALSLTTADPKSTFGGFAELTGGNRGRVEARGAVTGQIAEDLTGRLAISGQTRDGYYYNRAFNRRAGDSEGLSLRGKLKYQPSDALTVKLTLDGSQDRIDGLGRAIGPGAVSEAAFVSGITTNFSAGSLPVADPYAIGSNTFGSLRRKLYGASLRVDWNPGYGTVTFIPAYRYGSYQVTDDLTAVLLTGSGPATKGWLSAEITDERYKATSGELRFASPQGRPFEWLVGAYYLAEKTDRHQIRERLLNNSFSRPEWFQGNDTKSYAAFGSATWHPTSTIDLTVGARYTRDDKVFDLVADDTLSAADRARLTAQYGRAPTLSPLLTPYAVSPSDSWGEFTPDASATWRFADGLSLYGRVSTGFKSGGFNGLAANAVQANLAFDPEKATNFEVGLKARLLNNRVQINTTAFLINFRDLQLRDRIETIPGDTTSAIVTIVNAGRARTKGIETEIIAKPFRALTLGGTLSVLDAKITALNPGSTLVLGSSLPRSPKFTATASAAYDLRLANGASLNGHVEYRHVSGQNYDLNDAPSTFQNAYSLLNARLSYTPQGGKWSVSVWGDNLTNRTYVTDAQLGSGGYFAAQQLSEPRTYGATLRFEY